METWLNSCRSCLSTNAGVNLFEDNLKVKFLETTCIEISKEDGLPQYLCKECDQLMNSAHQFRDQCIKMDKELKAQLQALIAKAADKSQKENLNFANIPECDIKEEVESDGDDDTYYLLVIDNPEDQNTNSNDPVEGAIEHNSVVDHPADDLPAIAVESVKNVETPVPEPIVTITEKIQEVATPKIQTLKEVTELRTLAPIKSESYDTTLDYIIPDTRIPINVPATILENEEESQDMDEEMAEREMEIDLIQIPPPQLTEKPPEIITSNNASQSLLQPIIPSNSINLTNEDQLIKLLNSNEGTIVLKSGDNITYLGKTEPNDMEDDETDELSQDEVILCDRSSQFQILKYDGSELVIEYTDDGQIATVYQQDDGSFLCDCGKVFQDLTEYESHQHVQSETGDNQCNLCGKGFESPEILTGHLLLHSVNGLLLTCPFCNAVVRRNTLTQHIKYNHNKSKPQCHLCYKTFANPNNLKRHMVIHSGIKEFECDICFKRFHQKITMQTHRLTHVDPFACRLCDEAFDNKTELDAHNNSGNCTESKIEKVREELLKNVKQEITSNLGKLLGYACNICNKLYSIESALEEHILSSHVIDPAELLCSECGEVLPSKKEMQTHLSTHKGMKEKNAKRFECSICKKGCASQAMVIMHERVHTNERPYPCQLCSLRFKTKTHLRTHQLTHTREKKFGCSICLKYFALKGNLVVHLRTHTGERPYICSICDEAFIDSKYLKKHKLRKHSIENVPWNQY